MQATPGSYGTKGNYELVVPLESGGLAHFYRDNDQAGLPWHGPFAFGTLPGVVEAVSLIQSNFSSAGNGPGNLAVVARIGSELVYYYRDDTTFIWHGPTLITTGVAGVPSFVQARPGTFGSKGNYELVVPLQSGGLAHFYRDNDEAERAVEGTDYLRDRTRQREVGESGAEQLLHALHRDRDPGPRQPRRGSPDRPGSGLFLSRRRGSVHLARTHRDHRHRRHRESVLRAGHPRHVRQQGELRAGRAAVERRNAHFYRNNDNPSQPWIGPTASFGTSLGAAAGVSLIQSNFSTAGKGPGNLAVVSITGNKLDYFYRDDK